MCREFEGLHWTTVLVGIVALVGGLPWIVSMLQMMNHGMEAWPGFGVAIVPPVVALVFFWRMEADLQYRLVTLPRQVEACEAELDMLLTSLWEHFTCAYTEPEASRGVAIREEAVERIHVVRWEVDIAGRYRGSPKERIAWEKARIGALREGIESAKAAHAQLRALRHEWRGRVLQEQTAARDLALALMWVRVHEPLKSQRDYLYGALDGAMDVSRQLIVAERDGGYAPHELWAQFELQVSLFEGSLTRCAETVEAFGEA